MIIDRRTLPDSTQVERRTILKKMMYKFIIQHFRMFHISPTLREIGETVGINSTSVVNAYLDQMAEEGLIDKEPPIPGLKHISRGIKVVDAEWLSPDEAMEYLIFKQTQEGMEI